MPAVITPLPDLIIYGRAGCHLCDEARAGIARLLDAREARDQAVPRVIEIDIDADPVVHDRWFERIPVVELGTERLELVTSLGRIERLLEAQIDREARP